MDGSPILSFVLTHVSIKSGRVLQYCAAMVEPVAVMSIARSVEFSIISRACNVFVTTLSSTERRYFALAAIMRTVFASSIVWNLEMRRPA